MAIYTRPDMFESRLPTMRNSSTAEHKHMDEKECEMHNNGNSESVHKSGIFRNEQQLDGATR